MNKQANTTPNNQETTGAGGSSVTGTTVKTKFEPTESQRVLGSDTFSYYSNKLNLTKALQCKEDDEQVIQSTRVMTSQGPVTKRRKGSTAHPIQVQEGGIRKTRISYEAHPGLSIYDEINTMLERLSCADISDDEGEDEDSSEEMSDDAASKDERKSGVSRSIIDLYLGD